MNIDLVMLRHIMPQAKDNDIQHYLPAIQTILTTFDINTLLSVAHFIAQIAHESGKFKYKVENLNYSARALKLVFGKYFHTDDIAEQYARNPEKIANVVYANCIGNGNIG